MNRLFWGFLAAAPAFYIWVSIIEPVQAGVIYSQIGSSEPIGAYSSNDSGAPTDQKIADNFLFNSPVTATIHSLRFIGGYGVRNPPPQTPPLNALPTDDFRVVFFTDSLGAPGVPLIGGDFHIGPVQRTPTGGPLLVGVHTPLEYVVDLGAGITLSPSTVYWMSIVNSPGSNFFWNWANTAGAFDQRVVSTYGDITTGPWSVATGGGMYFELRDTNVPEPNTVWILLWIACGAYRLRIIH
jgi:hypothetical protein